MIRGIPKIGLMAFAACVAFAQSVEQLPSFEVASVKPAAPPPAGRARFSIQGGPGTEDPGQITYNNNTLIMLITNAYGVRNYQIQAPKGLDSERFDIAAKIPQGATKDQVKLMLQNLLAERFKLVIHREQRELPIYTLIVSKNGLKMKKSVDDSARTGTAPSSQSAPNGRGATLGLIGPDGFPPLAPGPGRGMVMINGTLRVKARQQTIADIINLLAGFVDRPVVDTAHLNGTYDFTLEFAPQNVVSPGPMPPPRPQVDGAAPVMDSPDNPPDIFAALQGQLGLKLETAKGPIEIFVIDHVDKALIEN